MGNPNNRAKDARHASSSSGSGASVAASVTSEIEPFPAAPPDPEPWPSPPKWERRLTENQKEAISLLTELNKYNMSISFSPAGVKNIIRKTFNVSEAESAGLRLGTQEIQDLIENLPDQEKEEFWEKNWVEIHVNIKAEEDVENNPTALQEAIEKNENFNILTLIHSFCAEINKFTRTLFVNIHFPVIDDSNPLKTTVPTASNSANYAFLEKLVWNLNSFKAVTRLRIILHTPADSQNPLPLQNLLYVLPFYDLYFTRWTIAWKTSFMAKPELVTGWPIKYLDRERRRLLERERAEKEREWGVGSFRVNEATGSDTVKGDVTNNADEAKMDNAVNEVTEKDGETEINEACWEDIQQKDEETKDGKKEGVTGSDKEETSAEATTDKLADAPNYHIGRKRGNKGYKPRWRNTGQW
ncbi:hypothetical protein F5884DRAFT_465664 [Xylogone sp. PMI_703]|nr:hypothetical protein F5884DRAFT_465664 [Xylogone sp. PMI_703]